MTDQLAFTDPWIDLRQACGDEQATLDALVEELRREIAVGHPLFGSAFTVLGRSTARDDVLLEVGGHWALVHLTWTRRAERPPWPGCTFLFSVAEVEAALED